MDDSQAANGGFCSEILEAGSVVPTSLAMLRCII